MCPSYEYQNRGLRHDEIRLPFERDFDRRLAEEQRVVADLGLHRQVLHLGAAGVCFPRLVVHARGLGHRGAGAGGDDPPALHLPAFDGGRRQIEADVRALLPFLGSDQHTIAHDDQAFRVIRHVR